MSLANLLQGSSPPPPGTQELATLLGLLCQLQQVPGSVHGTPAIVPQGRLDVPGLQEAHPNHRL